MAIGLIEYGLSSEKLERNLLDQTSFIENAGEKRIAGVLYDRNNPVTPVRLAITQEDLPVRVNMDVYGWKDRHAHMPTGYIALGNDMPSEGNEVKFYASVENNKLASIDTSVGYKGVKLTSGDPYVRSQKSVLFDDATAGNWSLSMKPLNERDYKFDRVTGSVYVKSKAINWYVAGPGLFFAIAGMIMFIAIVKKENPEA